MQSDKYIILDRDGVINLILHPILRPDEWIPIPKSLEAISSLTKNNYNIIIISNQSGVSRGLIKYDDHLNIHKNLLVPAIKIWEHNGNLLLL